MHAQAWSSFGFSNVFLHSSAFSYTFNVELSKRCLLIVAISKHDFQLKKYEPVALNRVVGAFKLEGL